MLPHENSSAKKGNFLTLFLLKFFVALAGILLLMFAIPFIDLIGFVPY